MPARNLAGCRYGGTSHRLRNAGGCGAVDLATRCVTEERSERRLGSRLAIAPGGHLLAEAHRGSLQPGDRAEYCMIAALGEGQVRSSVRRCVRRLSPARLGDPPKVPCAQRLIEEGACRSRSSACSSRSSNPRARVEAARRRRHRAPDVHPAAATGAARADAPFLDRYRFGAGSTGTITFDCRRTMVQ